MWRVVLKAFLRVHLVVAAIILSTGLSAIAREATADSNSFAGENFEGFVSLDKDKQLFVRWQKAKPGQPTVVLLNGLTYSTKQWDEFTEHLTRQGIGVLRYDMRGMGKTLLKQKNILEVISQEDQADDLAKLLDIVGLEGKVNLAGLSYGGAIDVAFSAKYPNRVDKMILMAPFTEAVKEQDAWIRAQIWYTRAAAPWLNSFSDDVLYAWFSRIFVYQTYHIAEPVVLEHPYIREGVLSMILGIYKWRAEQDIPNVPNHSVHLMIAGKDQYIKRSVMEAFWQAVPKEKKASLIILNNTEHKIPESAPAFSAAWVAEILKGNPLISDGREFEADPFTGVVRHENGKITFPREGQDRAPKFGGLIDCSQILR